MLQSQPHEHDGYPGQEARRVGRASPSDKVGKPDQNGDQSDISGDDYCRANGVIGHPSSLAGITHG